MHVLPCRLYVSAFMIGAVIFNFSTWHQFLKKILIFLISSNTYQNKKNSEQMASIHGHNSTKEAIIENPVLNIINYKVYNIFT